MSTIFLENLFTSYSQSYSQHHALKNTLNTPSAPSFNVKGTQHPRKLLPPSPAVHSSKKDCSIGKLAANLSPPFRSALIIFNYSGAGLHFRLLSLTLLQPL